MSDRVEGLFHIEENHNSFYFLVFTANNVVEDVDKLESGAIVMPEAELLRPNFGSSVYIEAS